MKELFASEISGTECTRLFREKVGTVLVPDNVENPDEFSDIYGREGWRFTARHRNITDAVIILWVSREEAIEEARKGLCFFFFNEKEMNNFISMAEKFRAVDCEGRGNSVGDLFFSDLYEEKETEYRCPNCGQIISMEEHMSATMWGNCPHCKK